MRKICVVAIVGLLALGCSNDSLISDEKTKRCQEVLKSAALKLKKDKGLISFATDIPMMESVPSLSLGLAYSKPLDVDQARLLVIETVRVLTEEVNANRRIRPYLSHYPFDPRRAEITIVIQSNSSKPDALKVISAEDGLLIYKVDDPKRQQFRIILKETYEEALERIK